MPYFVYMLLTKHKDKNITYVGYTNNLENRIKLHNTSNGAKFTKGKKWKIIYSKKFSSKILAMKYEYALKNDKKKRLLIKMKNLPK